MSIHLLILLVIVNFIWAANPVMGKLVLEDFLPVHVAWMRFSSGLIAFLAILPLLIRKPTFISVPEGLTHDSRHSQTDFGLLVLLATITFFLTPLLNIYGLDSSFATDAALITGTEPAITVLLALLILREHIGLFHWMMLGSALLGFVLLSDLTMDQILGTLTHRSLGNSLILLSTFGEASYSIIGARLVHRLGPLKTFGLSLTLGWLMLSFYTYWVFGFPNLNALTLSSGLGLLWIGPMSLGFCYLSWAYILLRIPVRVAAFSLFLQPILGAALGIIFWGDQLGHMQVIGACLMLASIFFAIPREHRFAKLVGPVKDR